MSLESLIQRYEEIKKELKSLRGSLGVRTRQLNGYLKIRHRLYQRIYYRRRTGRRLEEIPMIREEIEEINETIRDLRDMIQDLRDKIHEKTEEMEEVLREQEEEREREEYIKRVIDFLRRVLEIYLEAKQMTALEYECELKGMFRYSGLEILSVDAPEYNLYLEIIDHDYGRVMFSDIISLGGEIESINETLIEIYENTWVLTERGRASKREFPERVRLGRGRNIGYLMSAYVEYVSEEVERYVEARALLVQPHK